MPVPEIPRSLSLNVNVMKIAERFARPAGLFLPFNVGGETFRTLVA